MDDDLTLKQLRFARWYLSHKRRFYQILVGFLGVFNLIVLAAALYQFIIYVALTEVHELMLKELTFERIDYVSLNRHFAPDDLIIGEKTLVYYPGTQQYDLVVKVKNPNGQWRIPVIEYYFFWGDKRTNPKESFILPNQEKYLFVFRQAIEGEPANLGVAFSKIDWRRVRPTEQSPLQILSKLEVSDIELGFAVPEQKMISLPKILFKIKNHSVYNFWQVNFIVILYQGNKIVGVNILPVKRLLSNEERQIELNWPSIPYSTEIQVIPEIDIFDPTIFIPSY